MNLSGAMTLISELGATLGRGEEGGEVWEMWTCGRVDVWFQWPCLPIRLVELEQVTVTLSIICFLSEHFAGGHH